jgi:hypothetical protein
MKFEVNIFYPEFQDKERDDFRYSDELKWFIAGWLTV